MSSHTFQASGLMLGGNTLLAEKNTVNTFKLDLKTCNFPFLIWLHLLATQTSLPAIVIEPCPWLALHESKYKLFWNVVTPVFALLASQSQLAISTDYFNRYGCVEQTCPCRLTGKVSFILINVSSNDANRHINLNSKVRFNTGYVLIYIQKKSKLELLEIQTQRDNCFLDQKKKILSQSFLQIYRILLHFIGKEVSEMWNFFNCKLQFYYHYYYFSN